MQLVAAHQAQQSSVDPRTAITRWQDDLDRD